MTPRRRILADNLARIDQQIADAAEQAGRDPREVTLVAVAKYVDAATTAELHAAGCQDIGESRPQQLDVKAAQLADSIQWHLIGHLQRNKARRTLAAADWIHSVDSLSLLRALDRLAVETDETARLLLEVNISGDAAKHGFSPGELPGVVSQLEQAALPVAGLMTMASREGGPDEARRQFAALRELRDAVQPLCPDGVVLSELSMGMSGDFAEAIAEGATLVRIGSALYRGLDDG